MVSRVARNCALAVGLVAIAGSRLAAADAPAPAASTSAGAASSADRYENDWASRVRPWKRQPAIAVTVEASGLGEGSRSATSEPEPCTTFRPSERQIRAYVARARRVSQRGFMHEADWSACHATGTLRFRGGVGAEWMVQRYGAGYLALAGARYYLDCPECALESPAAGAKR